MPIPLMPIPLMPIPQRNHQDSDIDHAVASSGSKYPPWQMKTGKNVYR
jgi:hypothetical protein